MQRNIKNVLILIAMVFGLSIYLVFRPNSTPFYHWVANLGLRKEVDFMRDVVSDYQLPNWFINSLPDGLWMFALVLLILSIWDFKINSQSKLWIFASILFGLGFEITQYLFVTPGVFDWMDFILMAMFTIIALAFFTNREKEISR